MNDSISVIIPTYNRPQTLRRAIASVLAQTLVPLEILVCEDGISPEIEQIVSSFKSPLVKWLPATRAGRPAIPRNRGMRIAQGEWLAFLDDDDIWLPNKLEEQIKLAQATGCRAICANAWRVQNGKRQGTYLNQIRPTKINFEHLLQENRVICSSAVLQRSLLEKIQGFPESEMLLALEDYALWLRATVLTDFAYSPELLLEYSDEPAQSLRKQSLTPSEQKRRVLADFQQWAKKAHLSPSLQYKTQKAFLINSIVGILHHLRALSHDKKQ